MATRRGIFALLAIAAALLCAAGTAAYARHAVLDEQAFADRAAGTLRSDEVRDEVGRRIAERAIDERPQLAVGQAALEAAVTDDVAAGPAFRAAFRTGAVRMHRAIFGDADATAELRVAGSGAAVRAELADRAPALADALPRIADLSLLAVGGSRRDDALRRARRAHGAVRHRRR